MNAFVPDLTCTLGALFVYPVKSCAGIALDAAELAATGLDLDRQWMVVDTAGEMLTQRSVPRMALIHTALRHSELVLRAPGMLALHLKLDTVEAPTRVRVWNDVVKAYDMGALAAQWLSDFLGRPLRLARFDPDERRLSPAQWAGSVEAENGFTDGYPLLVTGQASLADFNARLAAAGHAAVTEARFRPNLALAGLRAFDEDHLHELQIDTGDAGPVWLRLVKPCTRCSVPDVDPATAEAGHAVGDMLAGFRADPRVGGGITFGMDAVVLSGFGQTLRAGQAVQASYRFD